MNKFGSYFHKYKNIYWAEYIFNICHWFNPYNWVKRIKKAKKMKPIVIYLRYGVHKSQDLCVHFLAFSIFRVLFVNPILNEGIKVLKEVFIRARRVSIGPSLLNCILQVAYFGSWERNTSWVTAYVYIVLFKDTIDALHHKIWHSQKGPLISSPSTHALNFSL